MRKGFHHSEKTKQKIRVAALGRESPQKGKHLSEETKQKIREKKLGKCFGERNPFYGKHHSDTTKKILREKNLGKHHLDKTRLKISEGSTGEKNSMWGKHHTEKTKQKIREARVGKPGWNKGLTKETDERVRRCAENETGEKNHMFGKHPTEETKQKNREKQLGKTHTDESKQKMREKHLGEKNPFYGKHHTAEELKKMLNNRPSGPELYLDFLLQNHFPDEWWFVGNGDITISGLCPDFIHVNGEKKLIEMFGDYWHTRKNMRYNYTELGRKETFAKQGYMILILWEHELNDEQKVIEKIKKFMINEIYEWPHSKIIVVGTEIPG